MKEFMPRHANTSSMNVALQKPWTQERFFSWAENQDIRYEFDGFRPVAMTGGNVAHSRLIRNLSFVLNARLRGKPCGPMGPDAGVETVNKAVRYPDALVTCAKAENASYLVAGVVVVFEVLSPTSGQTDRIIKVREYAAVATIRRYIIVESSGVGLTVMQRTDGNDPWTTTVLTIDDTLDMPEIGIEIPVAEIYENIEFSDQENVSS
jgi:Uma2 family endonuclease